MKGLGFLGDGYQPKAMELPGAPVSIWAGWESRSDPGVRAGLQAEGRQCVRVSSCLRPGGRRLSQEDMVLPEGPAGTV